MQFFWLCNICHQNDYIIPGALLFHFRFHPTNHRQPPPTTLWWTLLFSHTHDPISLTLTTKNGTTDALHNIVIPTYQTSQQRHLIGNPWYKCYGEDFLMRLLPVSQMRKSICRKRWKLLKFLLWVNLASLNVEYPLRCARLQPHHRAGVAEHKHRAILNSFQKPSWTPLMWREGNTTIMLVLPSLPTSRVLLTSP